MAAGSKNWLARALDIVFPPRCAGCGRRGIWLCEHCLASLKQLRPPFCRFCGRPTGGVHTCPECWRRRPSLDGAHSAYYFEGPLRKAIHQMKYRSGRHFAEPLSALLIRVTKPQLPTVDVVVAVPLHPRRERERGFNQSALLAEAVARELGLPLALGVVQRLRDTPAQMGLPADERRTNVRGAFGCAAGEVQGRRILLIDDVCTTGATLDACAAALKARGAELVCGLTVARAR